MSDFSDLTVARYLESDQEAAHACHVDPQVHADVERLRQFVDATERAMADEGVPVQVRERVVNRIVFGEPAGREAVYVSRREQMLAVAQLPPLTDAWVGLPTPRARPVLLDEEPTP